MTAVSGTRRTMKELVDGTIRVQIDIDPIYRQQFLKLFPSIDMPVAIAPLMVEQTPESKPAFAPVAYRQQAAMLCKDMDFHEFWRETHPNDKIADNEDEQAELLRNFLRIKSRSEIDTNPEVAKVFAAVVRDFDAWRKWSAE